jgi:hypothetical protein
VKKAKNLDGKKQIESCLKELEYQQKEKKRILERSKLSAEEDEKTIQDLLDEIEKLKGGVVMLSGSTKTPETFSSS